MDMEQEVLQFLGFFGICKEAIVIPFRHSKIFTKLTLTLIFPLSIIFLAHDGFSTFLSQKIITNEDTLDTTQLGTPAFNDEFNKISSELTTLWLIKLVYLLIALVFSLLSTSAIVYTVACIYTGKDISYKKVMSVVPKVWKRVMVTFLWSFGIMLVYNLVFSIAIIILLSLTHYPDISLSDLIVILIISLFYIIGFVHMSVTWQLATVISVMEDTYGIQAMAKSRTLIKGKSGSSAVIFLVFFHCLVGIEYIFERAEVTDRGSVGIGGKIGYGVLCLVGLTLLFLFGFVVQTIVYFVCKSYHHQNIDKSSLADHLEAYRGEYVPLTANNIQMEQFQV
ncbi:uncharacterized protein LOC141643368 [Silene latifolia]|uniref:uncharacterized protein LOC141643368 n=1 Tax=Silene latifolia TaxID=37657 RepID=UPI003D76FED2